MSASDLYAAHGDKLRFLVVGAWNTLFSVVLFNVFLLLVGRDDYLLCFWASWILSIPQSTLSMKYFAFRTHGQVMRQVARAFVVYLPAQGLATAMMWITVQVIGFAPPAGQLATIVVTTVFSYIGHKYFTFRMPVGLTEIASTADRIE